MKFVMYASLFLLSVLLAAVSLPAFGQQEQRRERDFTSRLVRIFEEADCPLSESQLNDIKKLDPRGDDFRKQLGEILNDDQKKAYRETMRRGERQRPGNNPRNYLRMMTNVLEREGHPLTDEQKKKIGEIEPGSEARNAMNEILTQEQRDVIQKAFAGRGAQAFIERITNSLKEAGHPLSEEQAAKLKEIEFGRDMREKIREILTDEQNKVFEEMSQRRGEQRIRGPRQ